MDDWTGIRLNVTDSQPGCRMAVNIDLRTIGEMVRRRGYTNRHAVSGTAAEHVMCAGRDYLLTFLDGSLYGERLT